VVNAGTSDGRTAVARETFTTLPQRVSLTLDKIVVHDDGDGWLAGDGDVRWKWSVEGFSGGPLKDCYRKNSAGQCGFRDVGEETVLPRTAAGQPFSYVFAQENFVAMDNTNAPPGSEDFTSMPTQFTIRTDATEDDSIIGPLDAALSTIFGDWGAWLSGSSVATWNAPQGVETASQQVTVAADDGTFRSTMYFTFRLFHDTMSYPANDGRVHSSSK
jgi:hypothetical protein